MRVEIKGLALLRQITGEREKNLQQCLSLGSLGMTRLRGASMGAIRLRISSPRSGEGLSPASFFWITRR